MDRPYLARMLAECLKHIPSKTSADRDLREGVAEAIRKLRAEQAAITRAQRAIREAAAQRKTRGLRLSYGTGDPADLSTEFD